MEKLKEKINKGAHNLIYPFDQIPSPGKMLKVADGVYWVRMSLPFALNHINLWVLEDGDEWVIVDTGVASVEIKSNWRKCLMLQPRSIQSSLGIRDKILSLDFVLVISILILGITSMFAMYSTDGGEFKYHTNSHILRFFVFLCMK